jgi:hypothetical protein
MSDLTRQTPIIAGAGIKHHRFDARRLPRHSCLSTSTKKASSKALLGLTRPTNGGYLALQNTPGSVFPRRDITMAALFHSLMATPRPGVGASLIPCGLAVRMHGSFCSMVLHRLWTATSIVSFRLCPNKCRFSETGASFDGLTSSEWPIPRRLAGRTRPRNTARMSARLLRLASPCPYSDVVSLALSLGLPSGLRAEAVRR